MPTAPAAAPLPPPDQLTGVVYRLADTSVPAEQKVGLVQYAHGRRRPALDQLRRGSARTVGYVPLTVDATDLAWAGEPGNVVGQRHDRLEQPARRRAVHVPMEFSPMRDTWQLSRRPPTSCSVDRHGLANESARRQRRVNPDATPTG